MIKRWNSDSGARYSEPWYHPFRTGLLIRTLAMAIDSAVLGLMIGIFFLSGLWEVKFMQGGVVIYPQAPFPAELAILPFFWAFFCLPLIYFLLFHWLDGQTVGKMLFGIQVVRADGMPITFGTALLRVLSYFVSAIPFGAGFLWTLFDRGGQGWHDKLSQTRVLKSL
jgi:uncharacterized RDD family membrane protein YckC